VPLVKTSLDDLTYKVNGLAMQVQHELKPGHRERTYQHRLAEIAAANGLQVEAEKRVEVFINEALVGFMYLDLWIENTLVVECKAHEHQLTSEEIGQVITYLAATGSPVGLIYNFGRSKLEFKRVLPPHNVQEWHKHLYRAVWVSPGHSLPAIMPDTPIRFSVLSAQQAPSVSVRLSDPAKQSVEDRSSVSTYASSGVNINSGNRAVELMHDAVRATYGPEVLAGIGAFGGLFDASALKDMKAPVLVASTDGVGTKVKVAAEAGRHETIGHDLVNHCLNDILVQGARPLFFLDYIASSKLVPEQVAEVVKGIAAACRAAGCALLGGETAEMPGVYRPDEFDVAGTIVGVVEREAVLPRPTVRAGDVLIGLKSSGPHTNGYSLIRRVFEGVPLDTIFPELGAPLADVLLAPHRSYLPVISHHAERTLIKALAHLTGGGFIENIPRVLPEGVGAVIRLGSWPAPPLFTLIQQRGEIATEEMYRVLNMGIGMVLIVAPQDVQAVQAGLPEDSFVIGALENGERKVTLA
jgi:phosphoribosylaminoimidazole synthetase